MCFAVRVNVLLSKNAPRVCVVTDSATVVKARNMHTEPLRHHGTCIRIEGCV